MRRKQAIGSSKAETARDVGKHVENDNGRPRDSPNAPPEEIRHVGDSRARAIRRSGSSEAGDEEIGDNEGTLPSFISIAGFGKAASEGIVAGSGRVEPASGSVHKEVQ